MAHADEAPGSQGGGGAGGGAAGGGGQGAGGAGPPGGRANADGVAPGGGAHDTSGTTFAEWLEVGLQAAQLIAIIAGGGWFLFQYREHVRDGQREQALRYAARAYEADLVRDLSAMQKPNQNIGFGPGLRKALQISYTQKDICPMRAFYADNVVPIYYSDESGRAEFFKSMNALLIFYTSLSICVNSGACDLTTACDFFFNDAKALLARHCTYFDQIKINNGYSPVQDIHDFLGQCTTLPRYSLKTLTPCEDIESVSGKSSETLYKACGKTASIN